MDSIGFQIQLKINRKNKLATIALFIFALNCISFKQGFAQTNVIDSLLITLKTAKEDTSKVNILNEISKQCWQTGDYTSATKYADEALALANTIIVGRQKGWLKGKANSLHNSGIIYWYQGNSIKALKQHQASLKIREKIGDIRGIASSHNNIGLNYFDLGNYPNALNAYFSSLKTREKIGDKKGMASVHQNIGNVYEFQGNANNALKEYLISLKLGEEIGDKKLIAQVHNGIGVNYLNQGNHSYALKEFMVTLKTLEEIGDKHGIAKMHLNVGAIYAAQGNALEALNEFFVSLKIFEEIGDKNSIASSLCNIGLANLMQNNAKEAREWLIKALALGKEVGNKITIRNSYLALVEADSSLGNFKSALENHKMFVIYKDSVINEENNKRIVQQQMQYDFDKKEASVKALQDKKDALTASESKKQKLIILVVLIGLIVVLVFTVIIYRSLRIRNLQNKIISEQKALVETQKLIVEEKQQDIIDSINYAKHLQDAILPSKELIDKHLPQNFILYQPKDIVAGDFYWMETIQPAEGGTGVIYIAACDCTGHGVPGAMVSVVCCNALNRALKEYNLREPGKILDKTRELVIETFEKKQEEVSDGMDISILCIDRANSKIYWSGANNPLWFTSKSSQVAAGQDFSGKQSLESNSAIFESSAQINDAVSNAGFVLNEIKANKQPVGKAYEPEPFTTHVLEYETGTTFYLFSDGYADTFGESHNKKITKKRFKELILEVQEKSMEEQSAYLDNFLQTWKGNMEQVDDILVIGVKL